LVGRHHFSFPHRLELLPGAQRQVHHAAVVSIATASTTATVSTTVAAAAAAAAAVVAAAAAAAFRREARVRPKKEQASDLECEVDSEVRESTSLGTRTKAD
jgi:hypothetical protein